MGTWGVLDSDLASDLAADFREIWHELHDDDRATRALLARVADTLEDPEDGPATWLAHAEIAGLRPAVLPGSHAKSVGHSWVWYMVGDLERRRDPERRYEIVATGFQRSGWTESRASMYGLGCSGCHYRGRDARFDSVLARDLERLAKR